MFFSCCSPISSKARSSLPAASSCTRAETQMPPGSARPSSRAAILTPSPKMSPSSTMMSPRWMPMRNSMRLSGWHGGVPLGHRRLDLGRAAQRVDDAGELDQQAVAGGLDDAARCSAIFGIDQLAADAPSAGRASLPRRRRSAGCSRRRRRREWRPACVRRVPWPKRRSPTAWAEKIIGSRPLYR